MRRFREIVRCFRKIKQKHPSFIWAGQFTLAGISKFEEDFKLAAESGLVAAYLGLETTDHDSYAQIGKSHNSPDTTRAAIKVLKKYNVIPSCNVILGLPTDGFGFGEKLVKGLEELDVPSIVPFTCCYLPGTALFNTLYVNGSKDLEAIVQSGWKYNNSFDVVAGTDVLSKSELYAERQKFFEGYFSYEHMLERFSSYYARIPFWKHPAQWIRGKSGLFCTVVVYNVLVDKAIKENSHYMAGGTFEFDAHHLSKLILDTAKKTESGLVAKAYVLLLTIVHKMSWILKGLMSTGATTKSGAKPIQLEPVQDNSVKLAPPPPSRPPPREKMKYPELST